MNPRPRIYHPQAVYLPRDAGVERQPTVTAGRPDQLPGAEKHYRCDSHTLFYDMFFNAGELVCLGPSFANLGRPTAVYCDGQRVPSIREYDGKPMHFQNRPEIIGRAPAELRLKIPAPEEREQLDLRFCFRDFEISVSCDVQRARSLSLPPKNLALVAFNRNNPIEWIKDWCTWHHREHGVQRIVFYDNGSRYFSALGKEFARLDEELEIILVHWPFPFGSLVNPWNKFCQTGALNHFRLFPGVGTRWGINLDIDEYLHSEADQSLAEWLAQPGRALQPAVYLANFIVPQNSTRRKAHLPRFFDYANVKPRRPTWEGCKYIFQPGRVLVCLHHRVLLRAPGFLRLKFMLEQLLSPLYSKILRRGRRKNILFSRDTFWGPCYQEAFQWQNTVFFRHYAGLNTGWKRSRSRLPKWKPKPLAGGRRVQELALRLGLVEEASDPPA